MLALPEVGFHESVSAHNCNVAVAADWIEASLLAGEENVTKTQVADILHEQGIYPKDEQDEPGHFCSDFLSMVWGDLERRSALLGALSPFQVVGMRVQRELRWQDALLSTFLLLLSCASYYPSLRKANKGRYVEQGELFEDFCCLSLNGGGWKAARTGWSSRSGAQKLAATVGIAAQELGEPHVNLAEVDLDRHENEAGCDLVCHRAYRDKWSGRPVVLVQCASGENFEAKLATPSIDRWRNYIGFSTIPIRGFCTPKAFQGDDFRRHCRKVSGLLLDRFRLLEPFAHYNVVLPSDLARRLKTWLPPRLRALPELK